MGEEFSAIVNVVDLRDALEAFANASRGSESRVKVTIDDRGQLTLEPTLDRMIVVPSAEAKA